MPDEQPPRYMSDEERLQFLKDWAEEKKYVVPGEGGTLAYGPGNIKALANGGPLTQGNSQYKSLLAPPSYTAQNSQRSPGVMSSQSSNPVKRWFERRQERRQSKSDERRHSASGGA